MGPVPDGSGRRRPGRPSRATGRVFFAWTHHGERQPRQEWLDDIASGAAVYHSIENIEIAVEVDGGTWPPPMVTAHTMADVTIGGERGTWRTEFRTAFRKRAGRWVAAPTDGGSW